MGMYINGKYVIADKLGNIFTGYFDLNNPICRADMRNAKLYKSEESAKSELEIIEERYDLYDVLKVYRISSKFIDIEEVDHKELFKEADKLEEVYKIANNSLYFADSSDYKKDLWEIVLALNPKAHEDNFELKYLE